MTGLFESDVSVSALEQALVESRFTLHSIAELKDRQWEREWLDRFKPMQFGRNLWVCPTGYDLDESGKTIIRLDPGLAFGTGTHETTRLCLEYLDSQEVAGKRVLDYGCGSGILGIGAALLGASSVVAIDNDPQALTATALNADHNNVEVVTGLNHGIPDPADIVLANILAQPLVDLADMLAGSGIP